MNGSFGESKSVGKKRRCKENKSYIEPRVIEEIEQKEWNEEELENLTKGQMRSKQIIAKGRKEIMKNQKKKRGENEPVGFIPEKMQKHVPSVAFSKQTER
jgi:hypothetical protein